MLDRREVIAAAAGAALIAPTAARAATGQARSPDLVFYDPRYDDSVAFAAGMARAGAATRSVTEDHGDFLRGPVADTFAKAENPRLSGLTLHTDFFVVSALARDLGGRLTHEGLHDGRGAALTHAISRGSVMPEVLEMAHGDWAHALAHALSPGARGAPPSDAVTAPVALFSWSIEKV